MIHAIVDFRGGYATNIPYELMKPNELLQAEDCYWNNGLEKRKGYSQFDTFWATADRIRGVTRNYMASDNLFILARDTGSETIFYFGASSSFTMIASGSIGFSNGAYPVEFARQNDRVVAVNGFDWPVIIYPSGTALTAQLLDVYDTRERGTSTWWAGQYDVSSTSVPGQFIDDTDDAQSTASAFQLANTTASDGFWFACDLYFNKFEIASCPQFSTGAAFTANYGIYMGSASWSTPSLVASINWTAAAGTRTLEWNWASGWLPADLDLDSAELKDRYVFRVKFQDVSATYSAGQASLTHTQFVRQTMDNDKPQAICVHKSRLFMAAGNNVYLSLANEASGWALRRSEYFLDGGDEVVQMVSYKDYLVVFKEKAIYGLLGNALDGWVNRKLVTGIGTNARRSVVSTGDEIWFTNDDGIWIWDDSKAVKVSKHIQSDFDTYAGTISAWADVAGVNYRGQYLLSWGPNAEKAWIADPDTFRKDDVGDGRMSFYKFNNYGFTQFHYAEDTEKLYGLRDGSGYSKAPALCVLETASYWDTCWASSDAIDMQAQTGYRIFGTQFMEEMGISRFKIKVSEISVTAGRYSVITVRSNDGDESCTITCTSPVGTGYYDDYWTLPHALDGKNLSFQYEHDTGYHTKLVGYSLETYRRYY